MCAASTTTYDTAQTTCVACAPVSAKCMSGAFAPIAASAIPQSASIRVVDPFAAELAANRALVGAIQQNLLIAGSCVIIVGAVVGIWAQRRYNLHGELQWLTNLDFQFANGHFVPYSERVADIWAAISESGANKETRTGRRLHRTALGAVLSIVCLCVQVMLCAMLYLSNTKTPTTTSSVSSLPPAFAPHGTFALRVLLVGSNMTGCSSGSSGSSIELLHQPGDWQGVISTTYTYNTADGSCAVVWQCTANCLWTASRSELRLVSAASSWASFVTFTFQTPALAVSATQADATNTQPFSVQSAVISADGDDVAVLRGGASASGDTAAAVVSLSLSPYVVTMPDQAVRVSYQPALNLITPGTVYRRATFQLGSGEGFAVSFALTRNSVTMMTTLVTPATLTFLILMLSMIGLATKLFSSSMRWTEFLCALNKTPPTRRTSSFAGASVDGSLKLASFETRLTRLEMRRGGNDEGDDDDDTNDEQDDHRHRHHCNNDSVGHYAESQVSALTVDPMAPHDQPRRTPSIAIELATRNPLASAGATAANAAGGSESCHLAPPPPPPPPPPHQSQQLLVCAVGMAPPSYSARSAMPDVKSPPMPKVVVPPHSLVSRARPALALVSPQGIMNRQPDGPAAARPPPPPPLGRPVSLLHGGAGAGGSHDQRSGIARPSPPPPSSTMTTLGRRSSLQPQTPPSAISSSGSIAAVSVDVSVKP